MKKERLGEIKKFIFFCKRKLGLDSLPKFIISSSRKKARKMSSFGGYDVHNKVIWVYEKNRNLADILRTIAHELVHFKQDMIKPLKAEDGKTGSKKENQANAIAAILMREYGKKNKKIYENVELRKAKIFKT